MNQHEEKHVSDPVKHCISPSSQSLTPFNEQLLVQSFVDVATRQAEDGPM
jgi:hypothetical protein